MMFIPEATGFQTKCPFPDRDNSPRIVGQQCPRDPPKIEAIDTALGFPQELGCKIILLKIPHILVTGYG